MHVWCTSTHAGTHKQIHWFLLKAQKDKSRPVRLILKEHAAVSLSHWLQFQAFIYSSSFLIFSSLTTEC